MRTNPPPPPPQASAHLNTMFYSIKIIFLKIFYHKIPSKYSQKPTCIKLFWEHASNPQECARSTVFLIFLEYMFFTTEFNQNVLYLETN